MTINVNCSYDALHGLIERSNTNERLEISDEWLRANEVLSIAQYQTLREKWNRQTERYGTWEVTILGISNSNLVTTFQALNPRQQEEIILTNDIRKVVNEYFSDKWCIDK